MSNLDHAVIECNNPEVIKSIFKVTIEDGKKTREIELLGTDYWYTTDYVSEDFTKCSISSPRLPNDGFKTLSKQFPDDIITVSYTFEHDYHLTQYINEYKDGIETEKDIIKSIEFDGLEKAPDKIRNFIKKVLTRFFTDAFLSKVHKNPAINGFINVNCKFEYENFKVKAIAKDDYGIKVKVKIYEKEILKYRWQEITIYDDIPF